VPAKTFEVDGVGPVRITKRRGTRHIRLSVNARQEVKVSLPPYIPYAAGLKFALSRKEWLVEHLAKTPASIYSDGARIGKSYRLSIQDTANPRPVVIKGQEILVYTGGKTTEELRQQIDKACERALRKDAAKLLSIRLEQLSQKYGYSYKSLQIKKLTSRWGSCSSDRRIALSLYLIQLPWHLIDYVILHELNHTVHMHHGAAFWDSMEAKTAGAKAKRKELKTYKPIILPTPA
jgi:predicted metal-dependent hydrolase